MRKNILIFILVMSLLIVFRILYLKNNTTIFNENTVNNIENKIIEDKEESDIKVLNNGGNFIEVNGNTYFWKLKRESRDVNFKENSNIKNELMVLDSDGNKNVIFTDYGFGKIYFSNNRLFLSSYSETQNGITYSINLEGTNKKDYSQIEKILDGNLKFLVYKSNSKIYTLNTQTDQSTEIFNDSEYKFLKLDDETIYYYKAPSYGDSTITLKSMNIDGKQNKVIKDISVDDISIQSNYNIIDIIQFEIDKNYFYVSYGYTDIESNKIKVSEISIIDKGNMEQKNLVDGYDRYKFFEEDNVKYLVALSSLNSENMLIVNLNTFEKISKDVPNDLFENKIVLSENFKQNQEIPEEMLFTNCSYFSKIKDFAFYILDVYTYNEVENNGNYQIIKSYYIKQNIINNEYEVLDEF